MVIASHQTHGRGRQGKKWLDEAGKNLLFSLILRPRIDIETLGLVTLAASVSVVHTIQPVVENSSEVKVKWPNDVLVSGRKICGMLLESVLSKNRRPVVILGIGLNVNQVSFPKTLSAATSLRLQTGHFQCLPTILASLLNKLEETYFFLHKEPEKCRKLYLGHLHGLGNCVSIKGSSSFRGLIVGVNNSGALLIQTRTEIRAVQSGQINHLWDVAHD